MAILMIFLFGIGNFAMQRAVLESGHPMVARITGALGPSGRRTLLAFEFLLLTAAMLLAANGWPEVAFVYALYSTLNMVAGWILLSRDE